MSHFYTKLRTTLDSPFRDKCSFRIDIGCACVRNDSDVRLNILIENVRRGIIKQIQRYANFWASMTNILSCFA